VFLEVLLYDQDLVVVVQNVSETLKQVDLLLVHQVFLYVLFQYPVQAAVHFV